MALITISGYPCSGKTRRAEQLRTYLERRLHDGSYDGPRLKVVMLSDHCLNIDRNVYNDSRKEKTARAGLFSAIQKGVERDTIVIVDSMNYIKGFRYQIYCAAREHKLRVCTVYTLATPDVCRRWNSIRGVDGEYSPETFEGLVQRYEEPSSMARWDSPLFTIPWTDEDIPGDEIWQSVTEGIVKPPNAGTTAVAAAPTDALHTLENTSAAIVSAIMSQQSAMQRMGGPIALPLSSTVKPTLNLPSRNLTLSELQRLKRQFVTVHKKAITLGTTEKGVVDWSEASVAAKFASYLEENLKP